MICGRKAMVRASRMYFSQYEVSIDTTYADVFYRIPTRNGALPYTLSVFGQSPFRPSMRDFPRT